MSSTEESRQAVEHWYREMWGKQQWELVPDLAGPTYTRHESGGTSQVSAEDYQTLVKSFCESVTISDLRFQLLAEADRVTAIGTWKIDGNQWDWVQVFRVEEGRLVETWLSGIAFESSWGDEAFRAPGG